MGAKVCGNLCGGEDAKQKGITQKHQIENLHEKPKESENLKIISQDAKALLMIIKLQAAYRGHYTRKLIKFESMSLKLTDPNFGKSLRGNYENTTVQQILQQVGPFKFGDKD
jgi:hypothetical protein